VAVLTPPLSEQKRKSVASTVLAIGILIAMLHYGRDLLVTLVTAITISFLLDPFVALFMRLRLPRALASFFVCAIALALLYLLGLGLYTQVAGLVDDLPRYSLRINQLVDAVAAKLEETEQAVLDIVVPKRMRQPEPELPPPAVKKGTTRRPAEVKPAVPAVQEVRIQADEGSPLFNYLYQNFDRFYTSLLLASFVPFLVYFMLSWRDHVRRSFLELFHGADRHAAGRSWQGIAVMARAYVVGNFALGVLLSAASTLFFWSVNLPYFPLIGPLSGFLSLVPYVGLPLAIVPPFFAALPVHDKLAPYLVIGTVVAFLHLLALNLLYPKFVGSRVHLNPLVVTIALMFWGTVWGALGLVFAIPITAGIKAVCDNVSDLQPYGKLLGD
jgi:predicted PurR-regulated permease PerM